MRREIDVAFVGIGENGHLAFNDPPADFDTEKPYLVVELDEASRRQQLGEGWFERLDDVPRRAISMSIKQIIKSKNIICIVPDSRKAQAVKNCFDKANRGIEGEWYIRGRLPSKERVCCEVPGYWNFVGRERYFHYTGTVWYFKTFAGSPDWRGKRVLLVFEGWYSQKSLKVYGEWMEEG